MDSSEFLDPKIYVCGSYFIFFYKNEGGEKMKVIMTQNELKNELRISRNLESFMRDLLKKDKRKKKFKIIKKNKGGR